MSLDRRLEMILPNDPAEKHFGYVVYSERGKSVFNEKVGAVVAPKISGTRAMELRKQHGNFAVVNGKELFRVSKMLDKVQSVDIDAENSQMVIKFKQGSNQGVVRLQVALNLSEDLPHLNLPWQDWGKKVSSEIEVSSVWEEVSNLITPEGEVIFTGELGLYGSGEHIKAFDYGVYLEYELGKAVKDRYFCPLELLKLGVVEVEKALPQKDGIVLVGDRIQYFSSRKTTYESLKFVEQENLKKQCEEGEKFKISFDLQPSLEKRLRHFAPLSMEFIVSEGTVRLVQGHWKEDVGKTQAPDFNCVVRNTIFTRWAMACEDHELVKTDDGEYYAVGQVRSGMKFYAKLSGQEDFIPEVEEDDDFDPDVSDAPDETPQEREEDIGEMAEGESLL